MTLDLTVSHDSFNSGSRPTFGFQLTQGLFDGLFARIRAHFHRSHTIALLVLARRYSVPRVQSQRLDD